MVQFASYLRHVLCKTRLIFPRINGPIVPTLQQSVALKIVVGNRLVTSPLREGLTSLSNSSGQKKCNEDFRGVYILWDYGQKNS